MDDVGFAYGVEVKKNGRLKVMIVVGIESATAATVDEGKGAAVCATGRGDTTFAEGPTVEIGAAAGCVEGAPEQKQTSIDVKEIVIFNNNSSKRTNARVRLTSNLLKRKRRTTR